MCVCLYVYLYVCVHLCVCRYAHMSPIGPGALGNPDRCTIPTLPSAPPQDSLQGHSRLLLPHPGQFSGLTLQDLVPNSPCCPRGPPVERSSLVAVLPWSNPPSWQSSHGVVLPHGSPPVEQSSLVAILLSSCPHSWQSFRGAVLPWSSPPLLILPWSSPPSWQFSCVAVLA